jgi:hypothetical protein
MVQAYVLIQAEVGRSGEVAEALANIPGVSFADPVAGPYDVIAWARPLTWTSSERSSSPRSTPSRE